MTKGPPGGHVGLPLGATLANAVDPLRGWAERNLKVVPAAQRRDDAHRKAVAA